MKILSKVLSTGLPIIAGTKVFAADGPAITYDTVGHLVSRAPIAVGGFILFLCIALAAAVTWEKLLVKVKFNPLRLLKRVRFAVPKSSPSFPGYTRSETG